MSNNTTGPQTLAQLIRDRRTIHDFEPGSAPPDEIVIDAIRHAVWAPNHHLTEPWRFYLLGPRTRERICALNADLLRAAKGEKFAGVKYKRWMEIPGWLLLTCKKSDDPVREREDYAACCCAAQNMMLCLWEAGVGVKWTTGAVIRDPGFPEIVGLDPDREMVVGMFWYGAAREVPGTTRADTDRVLVYRP